MPPLGRHHSPQGSLGLQKHAGAPAGCYRCAEMYSPGKAEVLPKGGCSAIPSSSASPDEAEGGSRPREAVYPQSGYPGLRQPPRQAAGQGQGVRQRIQWHPWLLSSFQNLHPWQAGTDSLYRQELTAARELLPCWAALGGSCSGLPAPHSMSRALPVPMGAKDGKLSSMAWSQTQTCL